MQLFYSSKTEGNFCTLSEEESRHCAKVLRMAEGDEIDLTDGIGNLYRGQLKKIDHKGCLVEISLVRHYPRSPWNLHIAVAPTKSIDRFEWFLEKATEIGIGEVTPLLCDRSERTSIKLPRLEKVMVSAMKQSLRAWLPALNPPAAFGDLVRKGPSGQGFIAYCETGREDSLYHLYTPRSGATVLVGPEGDFSPAEVALAMEQGFRPVSLGSNRLRTETAGVVACHTIALLNST